VRAAGGPRTGGPSEWWARRDDSGEAVVDEQWQPMRGLCQIMGIYLAWAQLHEQNTRRQKQSEQDEKKQD
jgi:hypothetical protein